MTFSGTRTHIRPNLPRERVAAWIFFAALLLVGLTSFRDYGVPWDEPTQRNIGAVSARYVIQQFAPSARWAQRLPADNLDTFSDRDYGVVFETPAVLLELVFGLEDTRQIYMMRHLLVFLVFFGSVFAMYRFAATRFGDWRLGLLAAAMLVLSPRIFADAFYNSKDLVFMAVFLIATHTAFAFSAQPRLRSALTHALATAAAIDLRVIAVVLVPLTIALLVLSIFRREFTLRRALVPAAVFAVVTAVLVVAMFPWLWSDPAGRFMTVVRNMSDFQRYSDRVRYRGESIMPDDLPWHYVPTWIAMSTPPAYLVLFAIGSGAIVWTLLTRHVKVWRSRAVVQDLVLLSIVCAPVAIVASTHTVIYDGWRHLYFVYPAFLMVALRGWVAVWDRVRAMRRARLLVAAGMGTALAATALWMIAAHPMQNVYFNRLAGHEWRRSYEVDYWGLGNRQAIEYLLAHDRDARFTIRPESSTAIDRATLILCPQDRHRVDIVERDAPARYVLTNYRGVNFDVADRQDGRELFYELKVDGEPIVSVYRTMR